MVGVAVVLVVSKIADVEFGMNSDENYDLKERKGQTTQHKRSPLRLLVIKQKREIAEKYCNKGKRDKSRVQNTMKIKELSLCRNRESFLWIKV